MMFSLWQKFMSLSEINLVPTFDIILLGNLYFATSPHSMLLGSQQEISHSFHYQEFDEVGYNKKEIFVIHLE